MAARIHLRLENLLLVFNKAMLPFLLQSPFPKNMCIGTFVQSRSKAFTKFSKGPEIQESNKYWDAAENKPNVCGPCSHGTSISSARMWRKERERLGMRQQSIQFRRPNSAESTETTKNTPAATARPCQSPVKAAVLKGRPNAMSRLPFPCQDQEVHHGKSWVEASPRLLWDQNQEFPRWTCPYP